MVTWVSRFSPRPISRTDNVMAEYQNGWAGPQITVLGPSLLQPDEPPLPHVFKGEGPCMNSPGRWHANLQITTTIFSGSKEWLLHYEIWKATGEWRGGGDEPISRSED